MKSVQREETEMNLIELAAADDLTSENVSEVLSFVKWLKSEQYTPEESNLASELYIITDGKLRIITTDDPEAENRVRYNFDTQIASVVCYRGKLLEGLKHAKDLIIKKHLYDNNTTLELFSEE